MKRTVRTGCIALTLLLAGLLPAACDRKEEVKGAMTETQQAADSGAGPAGAQTTVPTAAIPC